MTEQLPSLQKVQRKWRRSLEPLWIVKVWNVTIVRSQSGDGSVLYAENSTRPGGNGKCPSSYYPF